MIAYLKLVRIQNLVFIAFTQFVMHKVLLVPILQTFGFEVSLENNMLGLLIAATILIAAGGYTLNDYFDIKIDAINRPDRQIVGTIISRSKAMALHQVLTGIGVVCGLLLSYFAHSFTLAFIFCVTPGLLWFYSASYKRQFMIGNLVVAFNAALSILVVGISQLAFLQKEFGKLIFETPIPKQFYGWIGGFAIFSFFVTWIREIIKDIEDEKGDREMECHTLSIVWGQKRTKWFLYGLIAMVILSLLAVNAFFIDFEGTLTIRYMFFGIILPFIVLYYLIFKAKVPSEFHQASTLLKVIMFVGVIYSFVFYYLQAKTYGISLFNLFILK